MNACAHTYTKPQTSSTRSRGLGWRIHGSVEDTKLSTNKQHTLSPCLMRPLPCMAICRNTTTRRVASTHVSLSPLLHQCGARWVVHGRQVAEVRRTTEAITENDYVKILFRNGNLTSALAGRWRRLWARSGCGGSGRAPGWCGWAVASLLRRCCGGRPAISLPA